MPRSRRKKFEGRSNGGNYPLSQRYRMILSAVHMVYRLVNSTYNARELCLRLTRLLCQFIKASSATIYLLDPQKKNIELIALFNNKINILLDKKKDCAKVPARERKVTQGYAIFEPRLIGLPLVADDNVGAFLIRRKRNEKPFTPFDREMLSIFAEQSVTAIKNLQLYEDQQKTILSSIKFIDTLLDKRRNRYPAHPHVYFDIARGLGEKLNVGKKGIEALYYASILHDTGALDVPFEILSKTSRLTPEEFKVIRNTPEKSAALIRPVAFLRPVLPIVLCHHERYDGTGYPSGLKKEQIPLGARIMAVVDAFEAMIQGRPYKDRLSESDAVQEIRRNSGSQFDPKVVKAFLELYKRKKFRNNLRKLT